MMLWKRQNYTPEAKTIKICTNFADPSVQNAFTESCSVNARVDDEGNLNCTDEITTLADAPVYGAIDTPDGLAFCTNTETIFRPKSGSDIAVSQVFQYPALCYCPKNDAVLVTEADGVTYYYSGGASGTWTKVADFGMETLAWHCERAFGTAGSKLYFSDCDDLTVWSGEITFPCEIGGIASCCGKLYVVGQNIYRVDFDDDTDETEITEVYSNVGTVFGKTVKAVGESVFFLTSTGLVGYKNGKVTPVPLNVTPNAQNPNACAATANGRYWLSFAKSGTTRCDTVAEVDCNLKALSYRQISTTHLSGGDRLLFGVKNALSTFASGYTDFVWKSRPVDFDTSAKKHLRKLFVKTSEPITVRLLTESQTQTYRFSASDGFSSAKVVGEFEQLVLEICSDGNAVVEQVAVEASVPVSA